MSIFCFVLYFFPVYVLPATDYVDLIYVIKHLQHFNIQLMLNYWFTVSHPWTVIRHFIWLPFQLTRWAVVKYLCTDIYRDYLCTFYEAFFIKNPFWVSLWVSPFDSKYVHTFFRIKLYSIFMYTSQLGPMLKIWLMSVTKQ